MTHSVWTLDSSELSDISTITMNVVLDSLVYEGVISSEVASHYAKNHCIYVSNSKESFLSRILYSMGVRKKKEGDKTDSLRPIVMKIAMDVENYAKTLEKNGDDDE